MHYKLITKNPFIQLVRFLTSFGIISSVILKWSVAARAKPAPQLTRTAFSAVIPNKTKWREESGSMRYKCIKNIFCFLLLANIVACNSGAPKKTESKNIVSLDSVFQNNDSLFSGKYSNTKIANLKAHFPLNGHFPVVIDSAYMANVSKGHDSLGTKELKILVRLWHDDELLNEDSNQVCQFYLIDSLKAHHKFTGEYVEGRPNISNAYGLQRIELKEETLLVWALLSEQELADPIYNITTIYYTILNNNTILETGIMGSNMTGADPPGEYSATLSSMLTGDGKLLLDKNEFTGDIDSLTGETKHTHYEYLIHQGYTQLQSKKVDASKKFKMQSGS